MSRVRSIGASLGRLAVCYVLALVVLSWVTAAPSRATSSHGEAEHEGNHDQTEYCGECDCCTVFTGCSLAHHWVCNLSGPSCSLHSMIACTNKDPIEG